MKCLCTATCFLNHEGLFKQYRKGQTQEFKKCPSHFIPLGEADIDLDTVTEEALYESDIETADIRQEAKSRYGLKLRKDLKRSTVVAKFISVRNRFDEPPTQLDAATGAPINEE
jgi:hypothetical protein